jgi:6-phosphogluconate dehydrogenase
MDHGPGGRDHRRDGDGTGPPFALATSSSMAATAYFKDDVRRARRTRERRASLSRRRHQRRRLGPGTRLLPDGGRRRGGLRARLEPRFRTLAPGQGGIPPSPGRERAEHCRAGLSALRSRRRRPLRQDGAQRHRVRPDAGLRRGARHPQGTPTSDACRAISATISTSPRSPSCGGAAAWSTPGCSTLPRGAGQASQARATAASSQDSGEGRWTVQAAIDEAVPAEVLTAALYARFRSRQEHTFAEKMLSAMREGFGGHVEPTRR